ncbi:MAG TPA: hypothetical protein VNS58_08505 [Puia sp.]|nr:hypothetical protein [Puia sp.]
MARASISRSKKRKEDEPDLINILLNSFNQAGGVQQVTYVNSDSKQRPLGIVAGEWPSTKGDSDTATITKAHQLSHI